MEEEEGSVGRIVSLTVALGINVGTVDVSAAPVDEC